MAPTPSITRQYFIMQHVRFLLLLFASILGANHLKAQGVADFELRRTAVVSSSPILLEHLQLAGLVYSRSEQRDKLSDGEKWLGLTNLYYRDRTTRSSTVEQRGDTIKTQTHSLYDRQVSWGLFYRKVNESGRYHHFEFNLDQMEREDPTTIIWESGTERLSAVVRGAADTELRSRLAYQLGKLYQIKGGLQGDLGVQGAVFYEESRQRPLTYLGFPRKEQTIGLGIDFRVGFNYNFKRFAIGYDCSVLSMQAYHLESYVDNPVLTERQRKSQQIKFDTNYFGSFINWRNFYLVYRF